MKPRWYYLSWAGLGKFWGACFVNAPMPELAHFIAASLLKPELPRGVQCAIWELDEGVEIPAECQEKWLTREDIEAMSGGGISVSEAAEQGVDLESKVIAKFEEIL